MIEIYTDGSNVHNGKPYSYGGSGYIIKIGSELIKGGQSLHVNESKPVTNNRAELLAIIESLKVIKDSNLKNLSIELYSDSQWCVKSLNREWKLKKNLDLFSQFNKIKKDFKVKNIILTIKWVKGHDGHEYNEMADDLAGQYCKLAKLS